MKKEIFTSVLNREIPLLYISSNGKIKPWANEAKTILSGSFNPIHKAHIELAEISSKKIRKPILYELSIRNAEKQMMDEKELTRRISQFKHIGEIAITNASTFLEKSFIFRNSVFVIGYDTLTRILDITFTPDKETIETVLTQIKNNNCGFIVAGRLKSKTFKTLKHLTIPKNFQSMFREIGEDEFRNDISSTKIRKML